MVFHDDYNDGETFVKYNPTNTSEIQKEWKEKPKGSWIFKDGFMLFKPFGEAVIHPSRQPQLDYIVEKFRQKYPDVDLDVEIKMAKLATKFPPPNDDVSIFEYMQFLRLMAIEPSDKKLDERKGEPEERPHRLMDLKRGNAE